MGKHETLGVFDYQRNKICDLYDSENDLIGQAYDIKVTKDNNGYHTLEFSIPYVINPSEMMSGEEAAKYGIGIYGMSRFAQSRNLRSANRNFRWEFLRSDYLIRYTCGGKNIWFVASKPSRSKSQKKIIGSVTCSGTEVLLKTRNIYMAFDDTNGIGKAPYLMTQILRGTGWSFSEQLSDTLYERDGLTEKVRSLKSDGKQGSLSLITTVCNLFQCRPVFDTDQQIIYVKAMNNRQQVLEGEVGRNLSALTVSHDSSDISTRVYIEGDYDENGCLGIEDVYVDEDGNPDPEGEPWGLTFVLNFDYYKEIGLFNNVHQQALDTYLHDARAKRQEIMRNAAQVTNIEDTLNTLIGQCKMALYYKEESLITPMYTYGDITDEQARLQVNDDVIILKNNGTHTYEKWLADPATQMADAYGVAKFAVKSSGKVGAAEVQIEAKEKNILKLESKINVTIKEDKIAEYQREILQAKKEMEAIYTGETAYDPFAAYEVNDRCSHNSGYDGQSYSCTTARVFQCTHAIEADPEGHAWDLDEWRSDIMGGLCEMMQSVMKPDGLLYQLTYYLGIAEQLDAEIDDIEATFIAAMGYLLRDGYWSNTNYTAGQEEELYLDGIDMAKQMSKPVTSYTFSYVRLTEDFGIPMDEFEINGIFKLYDAELEVDEPMYIKKISYGVDNKSLGSIEVTNQDITLTGGDLGSLLSRMSQLADLIEQKNALYERAKALTSNGSLYTERLQGAIDATRTQILASVSNWYTDDRGNMVFISADGNGAMMLSGAGLMLSSGKNSEGEWDWRATMDGRGLNADEIVAGFISVDRLEAGSITANKLASDVGSSLDLSSNQSVNMIVTGATDAVRDEVAGSLDTAKVEIGNDVDHAISDAVANINSSVDQKISAMSLTDEQFTVMYGRTVATGVQANIDGVQTNLTQYQTDIANYMRYDASGTLTLGKNGSNFMTQLTNTRMSFLESNAEVAYISNQSMYITQARITDTLSLGTNNGYGYFDWTVTPSGLGLKWRDPVSLRIEQSFLGDLTDETIRQQLAYTITGKDVGGANINTLNITYGDFQNGEYRIANLPDGEEYTIVQANAEDLDSGYTLDDAQSITEGTAVIPHSGIVGIAMVNRYTAV